MAYTPVPEMSNLELTDKVKALEARIDALEKKKTRTKKAPESPTRDKLLASLGANDIVGNEPKYQATDDDLPKSFSDSGWADESVSDAPRARGIQGLGE